MAYVTVDVDVGLEDFDDDELLMEIESRGLEDQISKEKYNEIHRALLQVWQKRRLGQDFSKELDQLIYDVIGKVV